MLLMLLGVVAFSQSQPASTDAASADAKSITDLEHQVERAFKGGDAAFLTNVLGDDFRFRHGTGLVGDKKQTVAGFAKPGNFVSRTLTAVEVEVHGSVAVTNGRIEVRSAQPSEYTICYTRLYERRGGQWRLLSHRTFRQGIGFSETCAPR